VRHRGNLYLSRETQSSEMRFEMASNAQRERGESVDSKATGMVVPLQLMMLSEVGRITRKE